MSSANGGWVEAKDPKSGKSYYYNKQTKKTTWQRPPEMDDPAAATKPSAPAPSASNSNSTAATDPNEIGSNWASVTDQKSGKQYYYNKVTKKTSWSKPTCMTRTTGSAAQPSAPAASTTATAPSPSASTPAPATTAAAKPEWAEAKDPSTGRSYWYNRVTKERTWKNPFATPASAPTPSSASPAAPTSGDAAPSPSPAAPSSSSSPPSSSPQSDTADLDRKARLMSLKDDDDDSDHDDVPMQSASSGASASSPAPTAPSPDARAASDGSSEHHTDIRDLCRDDDSEDESGGSSDARKKLVEDEEDGGHEFRFAKHRKGIWNRVLRTGSIFDENKLLSFKKSLIKKALLKQNRELDEEAVQTFKNIMSYMGDRRSSKGPMEHAKKMLRNLMVAPSGLRDEAYMQICKQTNGNPKPESTVKGWELMNYFLATFPPSKNLKSFLVGHIKKAIEEKEPQHPSIPVLAQTALDRLPTILNLGQRNQVPSEVELKCLRDGVKVPVKFSVCDGNFVTMNVDPYMLVSEATEELHKQFHIKYKIPFAVYEAATVNEERLLDPTERVLDIIAGWENKPLVEEVKVDKKAEKAKVYEKAPDKSKKGAVEPKPIKYDKLMYKAKLVLKTNNPELVADHEAVHLVYIQAVSDVVSERYPCNEKDVTVLAALQLQASFGDYKKDTHVPGWLRPKLSAFIPERLIRKPGATKISDSLAAEWEQKILSKYVKVSGFTTIEAKLNYLDYVQEWVYYGATFFMVEQRQFKDYPSALSFGITTEGCLLMHPEKRSVLENYAYTDIVTWGHSDEKFIIVVGNIVQQRKLIFKTTDGKVMNHLIHDYVKLKVKAKETGSNASTLPAATAISL